MASASCSGWRPAGSAFEVDNLVKILQTSSTAAVNSSMGLDPGILTFTGNQARQSEMRAARELTIYTE